MQYSFFSYSLSHVLSGVWQSDFVYLVSHQSHRLHNDVTLRQRKVAMFCFTLVYGLIKLFTKCLFRCSVWGPVFLKKWLSTQLCWRSQAHVLCISACCLSAFVIDTEHGLLCSAWNGKKAWVSFQHIPSPLPRGLCSSFHGLNKTLEGLHGVVYDCTLDVVFDQFQLRERMPNSCKKYDLSACTNSTHSEKTGSNFLFCNCNCVFMLKKYLEYELK